MHTELLNTLHQEQRQEDGMADQPATPEEIESLRRNSLKELGADIPEGYAEFLALSNGLNWNGLTFFGCKRREADGKNIFLEGFVEANVGLRKSGRFQDKLAVGDSGMDLYVYNTETAKYNIIDRVSLDVYEVHDSFEALFVQVVNVRR